MNVAQTHRRTRVILAAVTSWLGAQVVYLLTLLAAASRPRRPPPAHEAGKLYFAVVVPAHNEEALIEATLKSLRRLDYPPDRFEVTVIADNCQDQTAALAQAHGVSVYERRDSDKRGKGHALAWGLEKLEADKRKMDAVVVIDADCEVSPNLLNAMEARFARGASAVQVEYLVANPDESTLSALQFAAFALMNNVRPRGKDALGLSCGLFGSGMGFVRGTLHRVPWNAHSLVEDFEYHARLVSIGERVAFVPEASVTSAMPTSVAGGSSQQARWESGKLALVTGWTPRLIVGGLRHRDPLRLHAGLEHLIAPQSLLAGSSLVVAGVAVLLRARVTLIVASLTLAGQFVFVIGGLVLVRAPSSVYRALARAPAFAIRKVRLYARLTLGRGPTTWVRTGRAEA